MSSGNHVRHVGVDAHQFRRRLHAHKLGDDGAPVTTLRDKFRVSEALHQHGPGTRNVGGIPPSPDRPYRRPIIRASTIAHIERIGCISAVFGGIGQRVDRLICSVIEPGHPCVTDQRQRIFVLRADVNEVNVQPIDLSDELWQRVQLRLDFAPVVFFRPISRGWSRAPVPRSA